MALYKEATCTFTDGYYQTPFCMILYSEVRLVMSFDIAHKHQSGTELKSACSQRMRVNGEADQSLTGHYSAISSTSNIIII